MKRRQFWRSDVSRLPIEAYCSDKTDPFTRQRLNQTLRLTIVRDRGSRGIDAARQSRIRDDAVVPDGGDKIGLADDLLVVGDHIGQQVEDLRFNGHELLASTQFAPIRIERKAFKKVAHGETRAVTKPPYTTGGHKNQDCRKELPKVSQGSR